MLTVFAQGGGAAGTVGSATSAPRTSATTSSGRATIEERSGSILGADAPDPFILVTDAGPILFTTNTASGNVPARSAADRSNVVDALPVLPAWAEAGSTWAPAVLATDDGYVLAFTARDAASGRQCIGIATSAGPLGPYAAQDEPLLCDVDDGGAIDPSFVVDDDGTILLLYKVDGNCCGLPTSISVVSLDSTATAIAGQAATLLVADRDWEGGVVEAPSMVEVEGRWLLLYSANDWSGAAYAVGAAWCESPVGPCTKLGGPVFESGAGLDGPGGLEVVADGPVAGVLLVAFHAWPEDRVGYASGSARQLHLGRIEIDGDRVSVEER